MKKKLLLGLFTVSTLLLLNNVYAYECQYSEGGIPCCKKYGKTKVPSGKVVEKTCDYLVSSSACTNENKQWSDCGTVEKEFTGGEGWSIEAEKRCSELEGTEFSDKTGKKLYKSCSVTKTRLGSGGNKTYIYTCKCAVKSLQASQCCHKQICPEGSVEKDGQCITTKTTEINTCLEYEKIEDPQTRVCPPVINWKTSSKFECFSKMESYSDGSDWNFCIYPDKTLLVDSKTDDSEYGLGDNDFCPVSCVEDFSANASSITPSVKAGSNFIFPESSNYLSGQRWCKTQKIDWNKFISQLNYANEQISKYYELWKIKERQETDLVKFVPSTRPDCDYYCDRGDALGNGYCCTGYETQKKEGSCTTVDGVERNCTYVTVCVSTIPETAHGYTWRYLGKYNNSDGMVRVDGKLNTANVSSWCDSTGSTIYTPVLSESAKTYERLYINWLNRAKAIKERMKNCYDWGDFSQEDKKKNFYNVNPKVNLTYKGANGNIYTYDGNLNVSTEITMTSDLYDCDANNPKLTLIVGYDSNNNKITKDFYDVRKCRNREVKANALSTVKLSDDVYRYVNKTNGQSFHANQLASFGNSKYFNYIDIGHGNLPVGFATKPGVYGYSTGLGELSLTYTNIGHLDANGESRIEKLMQEQANNDSISDYNKVYCDYKVTNGLVPSDPPKPTDSTGGITLIYRPIDLYEPFPNIDGKGRNTGANWCDSNNCSNTNNVVKKYILNNRNVVGDEVYNLEPMYSFKLTPAIINRIREYNKNNAYDYDSTGMKTGMVCDKGKGTRCISDYLTELIEMTEATGTCTQNRKDTFDTCRY